MSMYRRRLMIANALKKSSGINYPGLIAAWSAKGKTNDDEDRAILKDLTGNGHDITLNGFAFSEMSGYGGYWANYKNWITKDDSFYIKEISDHTIHISQIVKYSTNIVFLEKTKLSNLPKYKIKVKGITGNVTSFKIDYTVGSKITEIINITQDGIYEINQLNENTDYYRYHIAKNTNEPITCDVLIELLPEYPDALVFDGVDDYGQSIDRIKALTKYTIILKRKIIKATNGGCVLYKGDLHYVDSTENFGVEFTDNKYWYYYSGLLGNNKIIPYQEDIIYAKEKSYNGQQMNSNLDNVADNPIVISTVNKTGFVNMAFYSAYLFDRSLDEQEIKEFIRKYIDPEYLLPSEIPTPDCYYDFSLGSNDDENRETIKDQSGNGNNAKAYNIAWNEEGSGYKDGALYLDGIDD